MTLNPGSSAPSEVAADVARASIVPSWTSWLLSGAATVIWLIAVLAGGLVGRVLGHWESALTMVFGSFLSGSSPGGGGAVAFPVFTKGLHIPPPVARTFGLCIQAVGMTMASVSIVLFRRAVHVRAVLLGSGVAVTTFLIGVVFLGDGSLAFWPSIVPSPWVKASFSIVLATTSILMVRHLARDGEPHQPLPWGRRLDVAVVVAAGVGGLLSSMTGTGANILLFLTLVVLADVGPKVALPSAIMVMTSVSIVGFVVLGLLDGQLDLMVVDDQVTSVGGQSVAFAASQADLLGLWLAAVPVVVWGAPFGSFVAALVAERHLVRSVAALAFVEVLTTFILVSELRSDPLLVAYFVIGLAVVPAGVIMVQNRRHRLLVSP